jgi:GntR family transcriptional regulator/MocR family aminotransferase
MEPLFQLGITLPPRGSRSILVSLKNQLRTAILDGRLKPGVRLPSTRAWRHLYGVSRNTAIAAYDMLLGEGYIVARRGSGTVVADTRPRAPVAPRSGRDRSAQRLLHPHWQGRSPAVRRATAAMPFVFQVGAPDFASFPFEIWRRLSNRALRRYGARAPLGADPQGDAALRHAIARHVSFARAVACNPQDIVVTAGAQQAFDLLARVLATRDRAAVALENPGYPPMRAAFQAHGSRIVPVPVDEEGLMVDRIPRSARVVCVTPSHQFPLGTVMSAQRRLALLERCQQHGAVIIEDDYDAEFRFGDRPLDALQTLDRAQSVFYVGTFSKSLLPDIRLGYIVAPSWAVPALAAAKRTADGHCSLLAQDTLAQLIGEGHLARHVRRMQRIYRRRREFLLGQLRSAFDRWLEPLPSVAGLHVTAKLESSRDESSIVERARMNGVGVTALRPFYAGAPGMQGLVLGYGNIDDRAIEAGLRRLRRSIAAA